MGLSYGDCDRLAKMVPAELKMDLSKALKESPEFKAAYDSEDVTRELVDTAFVLEDITRNASVHAAGVVIGDQPLDNLLPLKKDEDGTIVTQYAMGPVGDLGLLKMDFLGLKTLTVIEDTVKLIRKREPSFSLKEIPFDDQGAFDLYNRGETIGLFQMESGGMTSVAKQFDVRKIDDIIALIALYRPGPMDLIGDYIKRKKGKTKVKDDLIFYNNCTSIKITASESWAIEAEGELMGCLPMKIEMLPKQIRFLR